MEGKFEKEKDLVCVPFYSDNYQSLLYLTNEFFKKLKISVSQQILNTIVNRANGDRQSLKNEMIKIENYLRLIRPKILAQCTCKDEDIYFK